MRGVSGTVPIEQRDSWQKFVADGVKTVYTKNAKRFARTVVVQELGLKFADKHKITIVPLDQPTLYTDRSNKGKMVRQIQAAVTEYDKGEIADNLKRGREQVIKANNASKAKVTLMNKGKCHGRKSVAEVHGKRLLQFVSKILKPPFAQRHRRARGGGIAPWSELRDKLAAKKFLNQDGQPLAKSAIERYLKFVDLPKKKRTDKPKKKRAICKAVRGKPVSSPMKRKGQSSCKP